MTALQINIAEKKYTSPHRDAQRTIVDLQLNIHENEFVCLFGPSGCGKTTLLNIVAGLDTDFDGKISVGAKYDPRIGYVFQNPRLLPWHTVQENIDLAAPEITSAALHDYLATMQLDEFANAYPNHLSLGMSRRVAIIRGFAVDPDILLMDEPLVSLDAPTARQIRELLLKLWQQRPHTVLYVTHDLREAITLADRLIFLSAHPMQIISDIRISLSRDQRLDEHNIESFRSELLNEYPAIKQLL